MLMRATWLFLCIGLFVGVLIIRALLFGAHSETLPRGKSEPS